MIMPSRCGHGQVQALWVIEDKMVKVKVEYIMVNMLLPPVEGEEQGQLME